MKRIFSALVVITILFTTSCHKDKEDAPAGYIEYQGQLLEVMDPVKYDSNGDGVIDEKDKAIEILGTNLNITENPDGSHFYSGSSNQGGEEEPIPGGGGSSSENSSLVPVGEKLCYHDLAKYCKQNGGLYAFETSANGPQASIKQTFTNDDANKNGIADYIEEIRAPKNIEKLATTHSKTYSSETEQKIEKSTGGKQISESFIQTTIKEAVIDALEEALYESNETVDITNVETIVKTKTEYALKEAVKEAGLSEYLSDKDIEEIAGVTAEKVAKDVANAIATTVSNTILKQYESQASSGTIQNVQGICPNGYHIPSDVEWMIFESALGMSAADLTKSGETEITRGANANIVKKMVNDFGFNFGGYASINGTYAQLGEAGVYWSSTTGTDNKGDYVWVRQIDTSYSGVVRFKMYEKSGLSVRCFKD